MSSSVKMMTTVFVTLALTADLVVLGVGGLLLVGQLGAHRARTLVIAVVGPWARPLALAIAATATAGSLYYSEVAGFTPCQLCWYQRALMYPLVVILAIGWWPRARVVTRWIALLASVLGIGVAGYHWLVERVPALAQTSACSVRVPCSVPWFTRLGFVTIAWMAMSGFAAIAALLWCEAVADRQRRDEDRADEAAMISDPPA